ncbi:MAG: Ca-activated chloride channel [Blastocatellia bacterium]|jgi:VWFA-related protein|nr:Ca-activated chloride channel [Blastocatellia bacterium]
MVFPFLLHGFFPRLSVSCGRLCATAATAIVLVLGASAALAQGWEKDLNTAEKVSLTVRSLNGRVTVIASDEQQKTVNIKATSAGAPVDPGDVRASGSGDRVEIDVRARRERDRIDITVRIPSRSRVKVEGEAGAVDVLGNLESAEVVTNTGTIHADVPLDNLKFDFLWESSRPRYLSDVELPKVKERSGGKFTLSGKLINGTTKGEKEKVSDAEPDGAEAKEAGKSEKSKSVKLDFKTQRGVVLLNIDPAMVPPDLHERPLTEAARAIVRSGDSRMMEAIRKVSPRMFGDYAKSLPPPRTEPSLSLRRPPGQLVTAVAPQLMRLNASVTDRNGRAIGGLQASDFSVYEEGTERQVTNVTPSREPFNLVLLLDVSGSVEERMDFIRKAARDFLRTASPQDRISIISFRDDIQLISEFSTDRALLSKKLDEIDAGGATALYDALGYVLADTLKPLRGDRTAVVVLSDGDDNKSFIPFPAILEATVESGALIYPLYVPSGLIPESSVANPSTTTDPLRSRYLTITTRAAEEAKKLAETSGGVYYPISRLEDLQRAYDDVVLQLRTAYTITYATADDGKSHRRIRVRVNRDGAAVRLSPVVAAAP